MLCVSLSKTFTKDDYIIFMLGSVNAITGRTPKNESILKILELSRKTNVIILGPSLRLRRPILNSFIHEQNTLLLNVIAEHAYKVGFFPMLTMTKYGFLSYDDKLNLAQHLYYIMTNQISINKQNVGTIPNTLISTDPLPSSLNADFPQSSNTNLSTSSTIQ